MNEAGGQEAKQALKLNQQDATMSSEEKTETWVVLSIPVFMAVFSVVMALIVAAKPGHLNSPEVQSSVRYLLIMLVISSLLFICLPILVLLKMMRRKMRTGSIYPSGEELKAKRARRQKPVALRQRITNAAFVGLGASFFTYSALTNPHQRVLCAVVAALLWLVFLPSAASVFRSNASKSALPTTPEEPQSRPEVESR
jgi:hypothetical protein